MRIHRGGCQCGAVRYEIKGEPLTIYACHCKECQRQSSSAFGMSMAVPREAVTIYGQPKEWRRKADSGREVMCLFCGNCGVRLFHCPMRNPNIMNLKPGTLDDTSWIRAVGNLWTRSAQPWVEIDSSMINFEAQPDDYDRLLERWQLNDSNNDAPQH